MIFGMTHHQFFLLALMGINGFCWAGIIINWYWSRRFKTLRQKLESIEQLTDEIRADQAGIRADQVEILTRTNDRVVLH